MSTRTAGPRPITRVTAKILPDETPLVRAAQVTARRATPAPGRARKVLHRVNTGVIVFFVALLGFFAGAPQPKQADAFLDGVVADLCSAVTPARVSAGPQFYGESTDSLLPGWSPLPGGTTWQAFATMRAATDTAYPNGSATMYEQYGMSGLTWSMWNRGDPEKEGSTFQTTVAGEDRDDDAQEDDRCLPIMDMAGNQAAQSVFDFSKGFARITISVYQMASSPGLFDSLLDPVDRLAQNLRNTLFLAWLLPVVMLGALWMAWNGLIKRRTMEATQGAIWMVVATILALAFLAQPSRPIKFLNNDVVGPVVQVVTTGSTTLTSGPGTGTVDDAYVCRAGGTASTRGQRTMSCGLWKSFVFTPWSVGQFGTADVGATKLANNSQNVGIAGDGAGGNRDARLIQIFGQAYNHDEVATAGNPYLLAVTGLEPKMDAWDKVRDEYWGNATWRGENSSSRFTIAVSALVANLLGGVLLLLISMTIIVLHLFMLMLSMMAPLFFLVGVHPGMGRRIALRWLEMWLGTFIKRIVLGFLIAVIAGFYQLVFTMGLSWGAELLLILCVSIAAILYRKPVTEMFSQVNLGGMKLEGMEGDKRFDKASKIAGAATMGAALAGVGAVRTASSMGAQGRELTRAGLRGAAQGAMRGATTRNPARLARTAIPAGQSAARKQVDIERDKHDPMRHAAEQRRKESEYSGYERAAADAEASGDEEFQRRSETHWGDRYKRPRRPGERRSDRNRDDAPFTGDQQGDSDEPPNPRDRRRRTEPPPTPDRDADNSTSTGGGRDGGRRPSSDDTQPIPTGDRRGGGGGTVNDGDVVDALRRAAAANARTDTDTRSAPPDPTPVHRDDDFDGRADADEDMIQELRRLRGDLQGRDDALRGVADDIRAANRSTQDAAGRLSEAAGTVDTELRDASNSIRDAADDSADDIRGATERQRLVADEQRRAAEEQRRLTEEQRRNNNNGGSGGGLRRPKGDDK